MKKYNVPENFHNLKFTFQTCRQYGDACLQSIPSFDVVVVTKKKIRPDGSEDIFSATLTSREDFDRYIKEFGTDDIIDISQDTDWYEYGMYD